MSAPSTERGSSIAVGPDAPVETTPHPAPRNVPAKLSVPRTRRGLLAGALGGVAAAVAGMASRVSPVAAAAGDSMKLGVANDSGTSQTILRNAGLGAAFTLQTTNVSTGATGIFGWSSQTGGNATRGVYGRANGANSYGVYGLNAGPAGTGAAAYAGGGNNDGVVASTGHASRVAVAARNSNTTLDNVAVTGLAYDADPADTHPVGDVSFFKAAGEFAGINGLIGASVPSVSAGAGVIGVSPGSAGYGVFGYAPHATGGTFGVYGHVNSNFGTGVYGYATANSSAAFAVYGHAAGTDGKGVVGYSPGGDAIYGIGDGAVTGAFSKASGAFKIDHPLDPAHKYLQHSFVESPDMLNVYTGAVTTDGDGEAMVALADWFEALNRDFRYQLTVIGSFAQAIITAKVHNNRFVIATSEPNTEVSWQVTGVRRDAWAEAHRVQVEVPKSGAEAGMYLHPAEHGQPESKGVNYEQRRAKAASAQL